jgi:RNA-directed DNA polymerase
MSDKRQKNQLAPRGSGVRNQHMGLAFLDESRREAPRVSEDGTESRAAKRRTESPAIGEQVMEDVGERENCKQALARGKANNGSPGVDGMTVQQVPEHLKQYWSAGREQLLSGT